MMFMLLLVFCDLMVFTTGLWCDPLKHQYYMPQAKMCLNCEKCLIGEEPISVQEWDIEITQKEGPTECRKCIPCRKGTVSEFRAFGCTACTDCTAKGMFVKTNCTASRDTVCTNISRTTTENLHHLTPLTQKVKTTMTSEQMQTKGPFDISGQKTHENKSHHLLVIVFVVFPTIFAVVIVMVVAIRSRNLQRVSSACKEYHSIRDIQEKSGSSEDINTIHIVDEKEEQCKGMNRSDTNKFPISASKYRYSRTAKSNDKIPLLNSHRTRKNSLPSDKNNPILDSQTARNDEKAILQTDGVNTFETNPRIPGFTRQFSYPFDNSVAKPKVTDNQILAKMSENTLLNIQDVVVECSGTFQENIPEDIQKWALEDKDFLKLSTLLIDKDTYKDVGYSFGLTDTHTWEISKDYDTVKEKSLQTLFKAQKLKSSRITFADIDSVLREHNELRILQTFRHYITGRINKC